jgi:UDP-N-acetylglucosamine 2-epimerase (non-hydrolysing)
VKVLFVFGTRPEAIKLSPIILEMKKDPYFEVKICVTGQHRKMLDQVLDVFGIVPDIDLELMNQDQSLASFTSKAIETIDNVIKKEEPDICIMQGDTSTTMASAIAAYYNRVPVAHVEAGLRTYNKYAPFPEEINRVMASHIADFHFAPTEQSRENLLKENIRASRIIVTGNTVIDALHLVKQKMDRKELNPLNEFVAGFIDKKLPYILVTAHRRENFGDSIVSICNALMRFSQKYPSVQVLFPVHLNPNIQKPVHSMLSGAKNIHLLEPLDYVSFVALLCNCYIVLTDSGGLQEEAPAFNKPVLIMREVTERPEAMSAGLTKLVGTDEVKIFQTLSQLMDDTELYTRMSTGANPYGDGAASQKIVAFLKGKG